ncbi:MULTISPECIES: response regulator transcription factor [unclassified Corynebacterium]|uniref:response regulator transcription factor n=1 Tax=unclassified Corynebacterium TaxID=2624378 RepID=UPI00309AE9A4
MTRTIDLSSAIRGGAGRASVDVPQLTEREAQVLRLWLTSRSKAEVAEALDVSENTVRTHISRVRAKYQYFGHNVSTKQLLFRRAVSDGLI